MLLKIFGYSVLEKIPSRFQSSKPNWCPWPATTQNLSNVQHVRTPDLYPGLVQSQRRVQSLLANHTPGLVHLVHEHQRIVNPAQHLTKSRINVVPDPVQMDQRITSRFAKKKTAFRRNGTTDLTRTARTANRIRRRTRGRNHLRNHHEIDQGKTAGTRVHVARGAHPGNGVSLERGATRGNVPLAERGVFPEGGIF